MERLGAVVAALAAAWVGAVGYGCQAGTFECAQDSACGADGLCESNGSCSFPDAGCDSGRRFGDLGAAGVAGHCVPVAEGSTGAEGSSTGTSSGVTTSTPLTTTPSGSSGGTQSTGSEDETTVGVIEETTTGTTGTTGSGEGSTTGGPMQRVVDGVVLLYALDEGEGPIAYDSSPAAPPANLSLQGTGVSWDVDGLRFDGSVDAIARSTTSLTKLNDACLASDAITLEAWSTSADPGAVGPPRIVTYSLDAGNRNFSLLHGRDADGMNEGWKARLTTELTDENGLPALESLGAGVPNLVSHVVFVHEDTGAEVLYIDGESAMDGNRSGTFENNWVTDGTMELAIGNELTLDRPFNGVIHLVAVYCRALSEAEVQQNFNAGY